MKIKLSHFSIIFFGVLCLTILANVNFAQAQCNSKVNAQTRILAETKGEITVEISSSETFVCKINTVQGSGIETVDRQNGNGSKTLKFTNLDISKIYQVDVEFTTEEKQICKRLQKNNLSFEPK